MGRLTVELDVEIGEVEAAVERVRASGGHPGGGDAAAVTVMLQPMLAARTSGLSFSRNPLTGLSEVVIEAVPGRGDRLNDDETVPDRWTHRWGDWMERPDAAALPDDVALEIARDTRRIAAAFESPVELEWVWDGEQVWWVQLMPLAGVDDVAIFSNRIAREVLPGIIKPLVWSVNVPMVNTAWVDLFSDFVGPNELEPRSLARSFAYRAYFNMQAIGDIFEMTGMPRDSLELLLGLPPGPDRPRFKPSASTMRLLPRMLLATRRALRFARRIERELAALEEEHRPFGEADLRARSDEDLLGDVDRLVSLGTRAAYANIVVPLLANVYNALLRRRLTKAGFDPERVEPGVGADELADLTPVARLDALAQIASRLDEGTRAQIRAGDSEMIPDDLDEGIRLFLKRFGHLSASGNDFSATPWRERPDIVVNMVLDHAAAAPASPLMRWEEVREGLGPVRRVTAGGLRRRTTTYLLRREAVSLRYTHGIGLLRLYFLEIGDRLVQRGVLESRDDVWYLFLDELQAALVGREHDASPSDVVARRRTEIEAVAEVDLPGVIYGDDFVASPARSVSTVLRGIPTSRGHLRGTLRVVRTMDDFPKVAPGDIVAIPHSDVAWNPLFARAGAVVAESGGMLSHSSIVAREYGIPCVVSVEGATRLPDGVTIVVDGYTGTVSIEDQDG